MTEILISDEPREISAFEPSFERTDTADSVTIKILRSLEGVDSDLWIGIKSTGPLSPFDLFSQPSRTQVLVQAAAQGIAISDQEFLFVDACRSANQSFLLCDRPELEVTSAWLQKVVRTCRDLKVSNIGFYFDSHSLDTDLRSFLDDFLKTIFDELSLREVYILTFERDYNLVLNAALDCQKNLIRTNLKFDVFH